MLKYITLILCLGWTLTSGVWAGVRPNLPPVFDPIANCDVLESDSFNLKLSGGMNQVISTKGSLMADTFTTCLAPEGKPVKVSVHATDPYGDHVSLSVVNAPPAASFSDLGNGWATLIWVPDYVGPWSSAQSSFELSFEASDGKLTSQMQVVINVVNVNLIPELTLPESSEVAVGNQLVFQVRANDLDSDKVSIQALNLPSTASFDVSSGIFNWIPEPADTGLWSIAFRAVDSSGGERIKETHIRVTPPATFSLSLGIKESLLGNIVEIPINLVNSDPVAGIEISVKFDPLEYTFLEASRKDCRTEKWEYFACYEKTKSQTHYIKIVGIADFPNDVNVLPLSSDSGAIVYLRFRLTTDPYLNGFLLPLEFFSYDFTDNTLSTPRGQFIPQENIDLTNGGVWLNSEKTLVGDINQNGLPFDVGDAVLLAGYLSGTSKLSTQQLINSDVNQDGRMASISDLVFLINHILHVGTMPIGDEAKPGEIVMVRITGDSLRTSVWLDSDTPAGGALVIFKGESLKIENIQLSPEAKDLELYTYQVGDMFRVLVMSQEAKPLPARDHPIISFEGEGFDTFFVSLSNREGELLKVQQQYEHSSLPTKYALYQNYPNPFNPETSIKYVVGGTGPVQVSLKIYNVAGQLVKTLIKEEQLPGQYIQTWNGKNEQNEEVASGVYFYKLKVSGYVETKKMVLLR